MGLARATRLCVLIGCVLVAIDGLYAFQFKPPSRSPSRAEQELLARGAFVGPVRVRGEDGETIEYIYCSFVCGAWRGGDKGVAHLRAVPNLDHVTIYTDGISDEGLTLLKDSRSLRSICLMQAPRITDDGLKRLYGLTSLRTLKIWDDAGVSKDGIEAFRKARPDVEVEVYGDRLKK